MSDTDKPSPEAPQGGTSEEQASPGAGSANVISIEQARAELLRKPRPRVTPPRGTHPMTVRSRSREVPAPVTLPPGEHAAVIVADTPAARAHIDKKTVHPGEAPSHTHEKKVRLKTSLDPRRAKTQLTDRRAEPEPDMGTIETPPAHPSVPHPSVPPSGNLRARSSQPPATQDRPSLARPRPIPRPQRSSAPLFLIGVAIAAGFGAAVVFLLGRQKPEISPSAPTAATTAALVATPPPRPTAPPAVSTPSTTLLPSPGSATATEAPEVPSVLTGAPPATPTGKATHSPSTKPSTTATQAPTASAKPSSTSVLPFGKEEN
jgi:hypothetical protein